MSICICSINFQRIIPKSGLFKSSEVFKQLNEEAIKTKADKDKEVKKWTTFLQKPNRPIPKSKDQVQHEPYRVKIVKQPKPMCDPNRVRTPPAVEAVPAIVTNELERIENSEALINVENKGDASAEEDGVADSEVPDLEACDVVDANVCEHTELVENNENGADVSEQADTAKGSEAGELTSPADEVAASNEDTQLEKQLLDVQNQLAALSSLPSTIQTLLESVSRQLNEILPAFKLRTSIDISGSINDDSTLQISEKIDFEKETNTDELHVEKTNENGEITSTDITDTDSQIKESGDVSVEACTHVTEANADESASDIKQNGTKLSVDDIARETEEQIVKMKTERVFQMQEEDWNRNKVWTAHCDSYTIYLSNTLLSLIGS